MSILVIIEENIDFSKKFQTDSDFAQYLWKSQFYSNWRKISIWSTFSENLDFSPYLKSIWVKIFQKSLFR